MDKVTKAGRARSYLPLAGGQHGGSLPHVGTDQKGMGRACFGDKEQEVFDRKTKPDRFKL